MRVEQLSPFEVDVLGPLFRNVGEKIKHKIEVSAYPLFLLDMCTGAMGGHPLMKQCCVYGAIDSRGASDTRACHARNNIVWLTVLAASSMSTSATSVAAVNMPR